MGQVTIYLEDDVESKMRSSAKSMNLSQSKWIANLIREKLVDKWPESVTQLAGSWEDLPTSEEIRSSLDADAIREDF